MDKVLIFLWTIISIPISAQVISLNGIPLNPSTGGANNCSSNGYSVKNQSLVSGSCVSLTQTAFNSGAIWACDFINLNESFKLSFKANFDAVNSGDGIAFVLQTEGVPSVIGGAGGGIGYSVGNTVGCLGGDCIIDPSVVVEFDIWDNSGAAWDFNNPGLGNINDISCDHVSIQTDGIQLASNALIAPTCLLPASGAVTDGLDHDVCIIWDVVNTEYMIYFDSALIATYNGDIRTNFADPTSVYWGFTAGSGGSDQNQQICSVNMFTNVSNPSCNCNAPVATAIPDPLSICSGETASLVLNSSVPGTTFSWQATNNPNVSGESTVVQSSDSIINTLINNSNVPQQVVYTVTPLSSGCLGNNLLVNVTVDPEIDLIVTNSLVVCSPATADITDSGITAGSSSGTFSYFSDSSIQTILTNPSSIASSGTYYILLSSGSCFDTAALNVVVNISDLSDSVAVLSNYNGAQISCPDSMNAVVSINVTGGNPAYQFLWSGGQTSQTISGLGPDNYYVTVTDNGACFVIDSVLIEAPDSLMLDLAVISGLDCYADSTGILSASVNGGTAAYSFEWSNSSTDISISSLSAGSYILTVTDINACQVSDTILLINPFVPSLSASISVDSVFFGDTPPALNAGSDQSVQGVSYLWTAVGPGSPGIGNVFAPLTDTDPDSLGYYTYFIEAISADSCVVSDTVFLLVMNLLDPQIPDAFSPNGDSYNDVFRVVDLNVNYISEFKIFNRWGNVVCDNSEGYWDGNLNGVEQAQDVYIYLIIWKLPGREEVVYKGELTLLR